MLVKEYRIRMPMTVAEYELGQIYTLAHIAELGTPGADEARLIRSEPFHNHGFLNGAYSHGQFTHKIYRLAKKVPKWITMLMPKGALKFHEHSWSAYPYCRTLVTNPDYLKDKFEIMIDSLHIDDRGQTENAHQLPPEILHKREVVHLDIANDIVPDEDYKAKHDPKYYHSKVTGRGPLLGDWCDTCQPAMTIYKVVTVHFGKKFQNRIENMIHTAQRNLFITFNRQVFASTDIWYNMSAEQLAHLQRVTGLLPNGTQIVDEPQQYDSPYRFSLPPQQYISPVASDLTSQSMCLPDSSESSNAPSISSRESSNHSRRSSYTESRQPSGELYLAQERHRTLRHSGGQQRDSQDESVTVGRSSRSVNSSSKRDSRDHGQHQGAKTTTDFDYVPRSSQDKTHKPRRAPNVSRASKPERAYETASQPRRLSSKNHSSMRGEHSGYHQADALRRSLDPSYYDTRDDWNGSEDPRSESSAKPRRASTGERYDDRHRSNQTREQHELDRQSSVLSGQEPVSLQELEMIGFDPELYYSAESFQYPPHALPPPGEIRIIPRIPSNGHRRHSRQLDDTIVATEAEIRHASESRRQSSARPETNRSNGY